jgi:diketogulonate reductase-like aldo/keto reductase
MPRINSQAVANSTLAKIRLCRLCRNGERLSTSVGPVGRTMSMIDIERVSLPGGRVVMPIIGLGTYALWGDECVRAVRVALDAGYRHVDTATSYRNEAEIGRALADSDVAREDMFITTKLASGGIIDPKGALEASLRALRTDYVDLWLIHNWPTVDVADPGTWEQLLLARSAGLARAVGVSNYSVSGLDDLVVATGEVPEVNQVQYGPLMHDPQLLADHRKRGVVFEGYQALKMTPLGHPEVSEIAAAHSVTPAQVALRWHAQHRVVCIPKSATPERIRSNREIFGFELGDDEMARLDALRHGT